ncbi:MAG: hypothetical protein H7Z10_09815 [Gemmatimonadaceae bacterium]|nr:hypothetical protein [Acetobacteraceae bacterium]
MATIEGELQYPSEHIPPMTICAERLDGGGRICTDRLMAARGRSGPVTYRLSVPPGRYLVFASLKEGVAGGVTAHFRAYYSDYVVCGTRVGCKSHKPIEVVVRAGEHRRGVGPNDWYART